MGRLTLLVSIFTFINLEETLAQTYFLNGTAQAIGEDCYRLTTTLGNQNGTVWYADLIDLNEPFDLEFTMNFGTLDGNGADGMVFVLQTAGTDAIGNTGQGIGYSGFEPSFGIEFDTWQNFDLTDPFADHIAMLRDGNVDHLNANNLAGPVNASSLVDNIEDGLDHIVRILWDPDLQEVEVWFDCEFRLMQGVDLVNTIFNGQNTVWWGFTGATGGAFNDQTVCLQENILSVGPNVTICTGASTQLIAAGDPNAVYIWEPIDGLDDPSSQTPIASPEVTTNYTVSYTDLCGIERTDEVTVEVSDLQVEIAKPLLITCDNPQVNLQASNNFNNDINYSWSTSDGNIVSGQNSSNATVNEAGTYIVEANFDDVCFDTFSIVVDANVSTYEAVVSADENIDCNNPELIINGFTNGEDAILNWNTGDGSIVSGANTLEVLVNEGGNYIFTVTNPENGCDNQAEIEILNNTIYPIVDAGDTDTLNCSSPFVELNGSASGLGSLSYNWTAIEGSIISGGNSLNPNVDEEGIYVLNVTDVSNGCSSSDEVFIFFDVESLVDLSSLVYPNVFSPNNDKVNELFKPYLLDDPSYDLTGIMQTFEMQIYNRWGNLVYETTGFQRYWDGSMNDGSIANEGVYFYLIHYTIDCGDLVEEKVNGTLQLLH